MTHEYEIIFSVNLGKVFPGVGEFVDDINEHLDSFGLVDELVVRSELFRATLQTPRPLTEQECEMVKTQALSAFLEFHPEWEAEVVEMRRKPCNQSCSQSRQ